MQVVTGGGNTLLGRECGTIARMAPENAAKGPTNEVGHPGTTPPPWNQWIPEEEDVPAVQWPNSVRTYHRMRTDSQMHGLTQALVLPIRRRRWVIDPAGASDEATDMVATDMGLPIMSTGDDPPRGRHRFNHDDHMRLALLSVIYGHMLFEQFGEYDDDLNWRLRKLSPRMPQSISEFVVANDGGLTGIRQFGGKVAASGVGLGKAELLGVERLVAYVNEKEGANWIGRSYYRPCYRHWIRKDRLLRIDAMKHEKYGLGVPVGKAPKGAHNVAQYGALAGAVKADPNGGVGLPDGAAFGIEGIKGALPDTIASIRYDDEAMARSFLAMVLQLGQTETGSRALGQSFSDIFGWGVDALAEWYGSTTSEHVIEDIIDWNFTVDEGAPRLTWEESDHDPIPVDDLMALIDKGLITVDDELSDWIRDRYGLPQGGIDEEKVNGDDEEPVVPEGDVPPNLAVVARLDDMRRKRGKIKVTAAAPFAGPGHRERLPHEVVAQVDFDAMQQVWEAATGDLTQEWAEVRLLQIAALEESVRAAVALGSSEELASITAPVMGGDLIHAHMMALAEDAISAARAEAAAQGVEIGLINLGDLDPLLRQQADAVAVLMARGIAEAAARQGLQRYGTRNMLPEDVAAAVRTHLEAQSDAFLNDQLGGALTQAQNTGRRAVFAAHAPTVIYASELLDNATCARCADLDGHEYLTMAAAELDYPTGGYCECLGGPRCRGTLVAIYDESPATS